MLRHPLFLNHPLWLVFIHSLFLAFKNFSLLILEEALGILKRKYGIGLLQTLVRWNQVLVIHWWFFMLFKWAVLGPDYLERSMALLVSFWSGAWNWTATNAIFMISALNWLYFITILGVVGVKVAQWLRKRIILIRRDNHWRCSRGTLVDSDILIFLWGTSIRLDLRSYLFTKDSYLSHLPVLSLSYPLMTSATVTINLTLVELDIEDVDIWLICGGFFPLLLQRRLLQVKAVPRDGLSAGWVGMPAG